MSAEQNAKECGGANLNREHGFGSPEAPKEPEKASSPSIIPGSPQVENSGQAPASIAENDIGKISYLTLKEGNLVRSGTENDESRERVAPEQETGQKSRTDVNASLSPSAALDLTSPAAQTQNEGHIASTKVSSRNATSAPLPQVSVDVPTEKFMLPIQALPMPTEQRPASQSAPPHIEKNQCFEGRERKDGRNIPSNPVGVPAGLDMNRNLGLKSSVDSEQGVTESGEKTKQEVAGDTTKCAPLASSEGRAKTSQKSPSRLDSIIGNLVSNVTRVNETDVKSSDDHFTSVPITEIEDHGNKNSEALDEIHAPLVANGVACKEDSKVCFLAKRVDAMAAEIARLEFELENQRKSWKSEPWSKESFRVGSNCSIVVNSGGHLTVRVGNMEPVENLPGYTQGLDVQSEENERGSGAEGLFSGNTRVTVNRNLHNDTRSPKIQGETGLENVVFPIPNTRSPSGLSPGGPLEVGQKYSRIGVDKCPTDRRLTRNIEVNSCIQNGSRNISVQRREKEMDAPSLSEFFTGRKVSERLRGTGSEKLEGSRGCTESLKRQSAWRDDRNNPVEKRKPAGIPLGHPSRGSEALEKRAMTGIEGSPLMSLALAAQLPDSALRNHGGHQERQFPSDCRPGTGHTSQDGEQTPIENFQENPAGVQGPSLDSTGVIEHNARDNGHPKIVELNSGAHKLKKQNQSRVRGQKTRSMEPQNKFLQPAGSYFSHVAPLKSSNTTDGDTSKGNRIGGDRERGRLTLKIAPNASRQCQRKTLPLRLNNVQSKRDGPPRPHPNLMGDSEWVSLATRQVVSSGAKEEKRTRRGISSARHSRKQKSSSAVAVANEGAKPKSQKRKTPETPRKHSYEQRDEMKEFDHSFEGSATKKRRLRDNWTSEEDEIFFKMVKENESLSDQEILHLLVDRLAPRRTYQQVRGHLKNMRAASKL